MAGDSALTEQSSASLATQLETNSALSRPSLASAWPAEQPVYQPASTTARYQSNEDDEVSECSSLGNECQRIKVSDFKKNMVYGCTYLKIARQYLRFDLRFPRCCVMLVEQIPEWTSSRVKKLDSFETILKLFHQYMTTRRRILTFDGRVVVFALIARRSIFFFESL